MRVRRATPDDAAAIAHVHRSARAEAYGDLQPGRDVPARFVAELDGTVIGFAAVDGEDLEALYVLPGAQGDGAGALLLAACEHDGARSLWVYTANAGARRFYERHGWTLVAGSETTGADWTPREPAVRYER